MTTPTTSIRLVFTAFTARATKNVDGLTKSLNLARVSAGLFVAGIAVRNLTKTSDAFQNISNQVKVTASAGEDVAESTAAVFAIAKRSRAAFQATATTFTRLKRVGKEFGLTQQQALVATEAIQKSFQVGGASAKEAAGSSLQLSQALGSGKLAGDELRAVLEGNVVISRAIAKEFGTSVGLLKVLGEQGKLVSGRVINGILKGAKDIDDAFADMSPTFAQAATIMKNSFEVAIGQINKAFDISGKFFNLSETVSNSFISGAKNAIIAWGEFEKFIVLSRARLSVETEQIAEDVVNVFDGIVGEGAFDSAVQDLKDFGDSALGLFKKLAGAQAPGSSGPLIPDLTDLQEAEKAAASFGTTFLANREIERTEKLDAAMAKVRERFAEINDRTTTSSKELDAYRKALEAVFDKNVPLVSTENAEDAKAKLVEVSQFATQAARNIQTAFADFLFDPFDKGLKGMLRGFLDIIRRMIAEAAAAKILETLFGSQNAVNGKGQSVAGTGFAAAIGGLFGFRDGGGFTVGGSGGPDSKLAAFRVSPGERVNITKPGESGQGGMTFVNNISINGNGVTMAEVNQAVSRGNQATAANLADQKRRGRI